MRISDWSSDVCSSDLWSPSRGSLPAARAPGRNPALRVRPRAAARSTPPRSGSSAGSASPKRGHPPVPGGRGRSPSARRFLWRSPLAAIVGVFEAVAEPADRGDHVLAQLLADARHEHLDRVGIAVEILIVNMLDQLGAAHHLALVVQQIAQQLVFLRGQLHRLAGARNLARARVEPHVAGGQFGRGIARSAADQRAQAGDQVLGLERLGEIIVGPGIEPRYLVRPRSEEHTSEIKSLMRLSYAV